jgi:hypothetical protein
MQDRLLRGFFGSPEGFGFNDFEVMSNGVTTDLVGEVNNGGCTLSGAFFGTR